MENSRLMCLKSTITTDNTNRGNKIAEEALAQKITPAEKPSKPTPIPERRVFFQSRHNNKPTQNSMRKTNVAQL